MAGFELILEYYVCFLSSRDLIMKFEKNHNTIVTNTLDSSLLIV